MRVTNAKLSSLAVLLAMTATGCTIVEPQPTGYPPPPSSGGPGPTVVPGGSGAITPTGADYYALVLEGVDLSTSFGEGVPPDITVTVLVEGSSNTSPPSYGTFDPQWNLSMLVADAATLESGIDLQIWADDGSGAALAGEIQYAPGPADFDGQTIDLGSFDYIDDARISLQLQ